MTQIPSLDLDPFSIEFFENPHPVHEVLREAGPVVRLDKWKIFGVARYAEVHAVLNNPPCFFSGARRRPHRLRQEEAGPAAKHHPGGRPAGTHADARGAEPGALADG